MRTNMDVITGQRLVRTGLDAVRCDQEIGN